MVGPPGLEPGTKGLWVLCSNQLSYRPWVGLYSVNCPPFLFNPGLANKLHGRIVRITFCQLQNGSWGSKHKMHLFCRHGNAIRRIANFANEGKNIQGSLVNCQTGLHMTTDLVRRVFIVKPLGHGRLMGCCALRRINWPNHTKLVLAQSDNLLFIHIRHAVLGITFTKKFLPFGGCTSRQWNPKKYCSDVSQCHRFKTKAWNIGQQIQPLPSFDLPHHR